MRAIAVFVLCAACLGLSFADEDKKTRILKYYRCMCGQDQSVRDEVMKCFQMRPQKWKDIAEECKLKIMPEATTEDQRWATYCKNEHDEAEELYECIMHHDQKKELTDEDKEKAKEYIACHKKLNKKFCEH